jgi:DNA-binding winged helix-turn-helix (wHTH) protein
MHLRFAEFELDSKRFLLQRAGKKIALRPKVFDLLVHLAENRDRVVPRAELVGTLWGETRVGAGSLSGLVNELRRALGESGRGPSSIRTVHARGYQFVAHVQPGPEEGAWLEIHGLAHGLEPDHRGRFQRASGGPADALDRIRFGLGQVLRQGSRAILVESEARDGHAALLDRALLLARHLEFEGIRLRWPGWCSKVGTRSSGGLVQAAIEACGAHLGVAQRRASDGGALRASRSPAQQVDETRAVRGEAEELGRLLLRSAGERPMLLAIEGFEADPWPLLEGLLVGAVGAGGRGERPIFVLVTVARSRRGDSNRAPGREAIPGAAASEPGGPLDRLAGRIDCFRLVAPDRNHLDRWLRTRGIDPLPEALADALVRHLEGGERSVEGVLDRLADEGEAQLLESAQQDEATEGTAAPARATGAMRSVRAGSGHRRQRGAETG